MKDAICKTDDYGNLTQYKSYQVIDEDGDRIKIIDDYGDVRWCPREWFQVR